MDLIRHITGIITEGMVEVKEQPWSTKEEALQTAQETLPAFQRVLKRAATKDAKIVASVKPETSIDNKLARWSAAGNGRDMSTMFDVLRGSILVAEPDDVHEVIKSLSKGEKVVKYEHKKDPDPTWGYYGTHHLDILVDGVVAEVQIMTKRLYYRKKVAHKIFTKHRSDVEALPHHEKIRSKLLFQYGNAQKSDFKPGRERSASSVDPLAS